MRRNDECSRCDCGGNETAVGASQTNQLTGFRSSLSLPGGVRYAGNLDSQIWIAQQETGEVKRLGGHSRCGFCFGCLGDETTSESVASWVWLGG